MEILLLIAVQTVSVVTKSAPPEKTVTNMNMVTGIFLGAMLVIACNFLSKVNKNQVVGFRMSWTMYNDITWKKSNRFAGIIGMIVGMIIILASVLLEGMWIYVAVIGLVLVWLIICIIKAKLIYDEEKQKEKNVYDEETQKEKP